MIQDLGICQALIRCALSVHPQPSGFLFPLTLFPSWTFPQEPFSPPWDLPEAPAEVWWEDSGTTEDGKTSALRLPFTV